MSEEKANIPEGYYYNYDLGEIMPLPTITSQLETSVRHHAQQEKAATLRGERPSEQTLRDQRVRRQAARDKDRRGR